MSRTKAKIYPTRYTEGQTGCMVGHGPDILTHRHVTVERLTPTMVVTRAKDGAVHRFTRDDDGRSVPYQADGGTTLHPTCQRPKRGGSR